MLASLQASVPDFLWKALVMVAAIGFIVVAGWVTLAVMKVKSSAACKTTIASERRFRDYLAYLRVQIAADAAELLPPHGRLNAAHRRYIASQLIEWMSRIRGEEHRKLQTLSRRLGIIDRELRGLKHPLQGRRLDAAHRLGAMRVPEAFAALCGMIEKAGRKPDAFVYARAAVQCATRAGDIERIVVALSRDHGDAARLIADMIRETEADPAEVTKMLVNSGNPALVRIALIGLPTRVDPRVSRDVARFTETNDKERRIEAVRAYVQSKMSFQSERVATLLRDPDWEVRAEAARELGSLGEPSVPHLIASSLEDGHERVREQGIRSLAQLQDGGGVKTIGADRELNEVLRHNNILYLYRKYGGRQTEDTTG